MLLCQHKPTLVTPVQTHVMERHRLQCKSRSQPIGHHQVGYWSDTIPRDHSTQWAICIIGAHLDSLTQDKEGFTYLKKGLYLWGRDILGSLQGRTHLLLVLQRWAGMVQAHSTPSHPPFLAALTSCERKGMICKQMAFSRFAISACLCISTFKQLDIS